MPIIVHQHLDAPRSSLWVAECEVDGVTYTARSRSGAPYALARVLVAAGIPDAPMVVITQGLKGETRYRSVYEMAGYTIEESVTVPVRLKRWVPYREGSAVRMARSPGTSRQKQPSSRSRVAEATPDD